MKRHRRIENHRHWADESSGESMFGPGTGIGCTAQIAEFSA